MTKIDAKGSVDIDYVGATRITQEAANRGMLSAMIEADALLVDKLSQPGQGAVYDRYFFTDANGTVRPGKKRKKAHRASAPGDPPAVDTGNLRRNRATEVISVGGGVSIGILSVNSEYAEALEFGTEKMAPRPFLGPIITESAERLKEAFRRGAQIL